MSATYPTQICPFMSSNGSNKYCDTQCALLMDYNGYKDCAINILATELSKQKNQK